LGFFATKQTPAQFKLSAGCNLYCMDKQIGVVVIIIKQREQVAPQVNDILTQFGSIIAGRMGFPYEKRGVNIVTLIVDGTTDQIGSLTGKLGQLKNVTVKTALAKV
jgi:putative iron-only hydrogenase system regulator